MIEVTFLRNANPNPQKHKMLVLRHVDGWDNGFPDAKASKLPLVDILFEESTSCENPYYTANKG